MGRTALHGDRIDCPWHPSGAAPPGADNVAAMRSLLRLAPLALLGLCACGDTSTVTSSEPIPLSGGTWAGAPVDPTQASEKVRVIAFFKPT